jgi:hypothetical protein
MKVTEQDVMVAEAEYRRRSADADAAQDAADEASKALQALKAKVEGTKEQRAAAKSIGDRVRGWMEREITVRGVSATDREMLERLADDLEYDAITRPAV